MPSGPATERARRVVFVQDAVPDYRFPVLDRMYEQLRARNVALRVVAGSPLAPEAADRPWALEVHARRWETAGTVLSWMPVGQIARGADLVILQQELSLLANYPLLAAQRWGGTPVAFFGHGRTPPVRWGGGGSYRSDVAPGTADRVKAAVARLPHWWFPYNELSADIVAGFGFPRSRMTPVQNAIDTAALRSALTGQPERDELRASLGLGPGPVALYCGRLYAEKRLDFLVRAGDEVHRRLPDFRLVVVGDGPDRALIEEAAATRPWLRPVGALHGADRVPWFTAADVVLVPGNVGLVILDAIALETPLVTSRTSDHGPEFAYLEDGRNGVVVHDGGEPGRFGEAVAELLGDTERLRGLVDGCREDAERYTAGSMADRFSAGILDALAAPPRWRRASASG